MTRADAEIVPVRGRVAVLDRLGVDVAEPADEIVYASGEEELARCELAVVLGQREDPWLGECLERCARIGVPALVVWISAAGGEAVAVADHPASGPCALCALWFDVRSVTWSGQRPIEAQASDAADQRFGERALASALVARYAASRALLGPGIAAVWNVGEVAGALHDFPGHPSCGCADRTRSRTWTLPARWADLASARFGPVVPLPGASRVARVAYRGKRAPWPLTPQSVGLAVAVGLHARERALAEAIERFAMLHALPDLRSRPRRLLDDPALARDEVASLLFRDEERAAPGFRFPPADDDAPLDWSWATRASSRERVLVPTSLVGRPPKAGVRLVDATSNGYACHTSERAARLRALLEVVERDALLLRWYTSQALTRIEGLDAAAGTTLLLATADVGLPVVVAASCLAEGDLRIGSAADLCFDSAVSRALLELECQLGAPAVTSARGDLADASRGHGPRDHLAHFSGAVGRALFERWSSSRATVDAGELRTRWPGLSHAEANAERNVAEDLAFAVEAVRRAGLDVLFVDRSLPELFGDGWHVTRALVPGAVEMSWGMPYRRLASPRLAAALKSGSPLAPWPHPYA